MDEPRPTEPEAAPPAGAGAVQVAAVVVTVVVGGWAIVSAKAFLVPLVLAVFGFVLVRALDRLWGRLRVGEHRLPQSMTTIVSATFIVVVGLGVVQLVVDNAQAVNDASKVYNARLVELAEDLEGWIDRVWPFGEHDEEETVAGAGLLERLVERIDPRGFAANLASGLAGLVGNVSLVLIYLFFLLLERPFFETKLRAMVRDDERREEVKAMLGRIDHDVSVYLGLKTLVSLMTALPSYAVMLWVGLDFAEFWAVAIFALNFIPNVGSLIATVLPSLIALVQFETLGPFWTVFLGVTTIQLVVANLIEPNLLGRRLNMSPLVVIVALVGWSLLWGVPGAFLCVPMTNIIILVLANIRSTRWVAVLLSRDGNLPEGTPS